MAFYIESFYNDDFVYRINREVVLMNLKTFELKENDKVYYPDTKIENNYCLIDKRISKIVSLFNKIGFHTLNSCEGHIDIPITVAYNLKLKYDDLFTISEPYIMFKAPRDGATLELFLNNLPSIFYLVYDTNYCELEKNNRFERIINLYSRFDKKNKFEFYKYKNEVLYHLHNFVTLLSKKIRKK